MKDSYHTNQEGKGNTLRAFQCQKIPFPDLGKRGKINNPAAALAILGILGFLAIILLSSFGIIPIGIGPLIFFLLIGVIILVLLFALPFIGAKTLDFEAAFVMIGAIAIVLFLLFSFGPQLLGDKFSMIQPALNSLMSMVKP